VWRRWARVNTTSTRCAAAARAHVCRVPSPQVRDPCRGTLPCNPLQTLQYPTEPELIDRSSCDRPHLALPCLTRGRCGIFGGGGNRGAPSIACRWCARQRLWYPWEGASGRSRRRTGAAGGRAPHQRAPSSTPKASTAADWGLDAARARLAAFRPTSSSTSYVRRVLAVKVGIVTCDHVGMVY
jgi:hypothetical protein